MGPHRLQSLWEYLLCHGVPPLPLAVVLCLLFPLIPSSSAGSLTFPPPAPAFSALPYTCFPRGTTILAEGLSCALRWVRWNGLELAVFSMGQPRPLLTEAALQPPTTKTLSCTPCVHHVHIVLDAEGPNASAYSSVR